MRRTKGTRGVVVDGGASKGTGLVGTPFLCPCVRDGVSVLCYFSILLVSRVNNS